MRQTLTAQMIESVARELLATRHHVTLRTLTGELRSRYGSPGRNARVNAILQALRAEPRAAPVLAAPPPPTVQDGQTIEQLRAEVAQLRARAERAEDRETAHQDYYARRLDERTQEIEGRYAAQLKSRADVTPAQYLRLHQRIAELERRLIERENPEPQD